MPIEQTDKPPYPNGWFAIAFSDEVPPGSVVARKAFGEHLVVWREMDGEVHVQQAHCPHLGAHLGHGGWVEDGRINCPFHGWQFAGDGKCVAIPYEKAAVPARLKTWPVRENKGGNIIMMWHDNQEREPSWEMRNLDWSGNWAHAHREWTLSGHPQEVLENGADGNHFKLIHNANTHWGLEVLEEESNALWYGVTEKSRREIEGIDLDAFIIGSLGPGLAFNELSAGENMLGRNQLYVTNVDETTITLRGQCSVRYLNGDADPARIVEEVGEKLAFKEWRNDLPIWANKVYRRRPMIAPSERVLLEFRRWYSRWYDTPDAAGAYAPRIQVAV